ncbi:MAG: metallophosphoesterase family protein [Bacteroidaceae bacterium]|nr:metallophosphoesterase family protein [Bacteroidaceae bacterium]
MKRKILILCTVLIVVALGFWCANRWDAWFGNPDEASYVVPSVPTRVLLTFGDADGMNRNVSWMCGTEVCEASVELVDEEMGGGDWVGAVGEVFESRSGKAAYYVARLRNLEAGHYYRYRVWTGDEVSKWYGFFVQNAAEGETSFLYMGDIQDTIGGIANQLLREAFRRNPDAEFFVCGGDLTERPTDAYWGETFESLDSVGQAVPVLTITGNHDYLKGVICQLERRFSLVHSYFLDSMEGENQVFTVHYKDVQLFCLDSNREFFYLWTQRKWLEQQLTASTAKWKVVVLHHPLYSISGSMNNLIQRWMFDGLIREQGVDLVLQAHEHAYARMTQHGEDGVAMPPVYTVSHCSPKNYRIKFSERFDKFGSGSRYYQKVRTNGDTLFLSATDACEGTLYDSLYVVKRGNRVKLVDEGKDIPEHIEFTPNPNNRKDVAFAERIKEYKARRTRELKGN